MSPNCGAFPYSTDLKEIETRPFSGVSCSQLSIHMQFFNTQTCDLSKSGFWRESNPWNKSWTVVINITALVKGVRADYQFDMVKWSWYLATYCPLDVGAKRLTV
jgi:hypothetical protein